ncbi:PH domain-containing protein [Patescibacteria group bacterium]
MKEGEEPLLLLRQHWATFLWPLLRTIILTGLSVPLIPYAFNYLWATIAIIAWWGFVAGWALVSWFTWYFNITLVTSQRIIGIEQVGPLSRRVREASYEKIIEVTFQIKGLWATIFGFGNVEICSAGQEKPLIIKAVMSPEVVKDQLLKVQNFLKKKEDKNSALDLEKLAQLIRDNKGEQSVKVRVTNTDKDKANDQ